MPRPSAVLWRLQSCARWMLVLLPMVWIAVLMRACLLNVPFMDDYVWLPFYEKIARHEFSVSDFFFVQMEHRLTVPCFLAWLMHQISPGQITLHNWLSFAQMALITFNLCWLIRRTSVSPRWNWVLMALTAWTVFSPAQFSTILWSDCFSSFLPVTFLTTTLVLFCSRLRPPVKFGLCITCAALGTHCFASGIQTWFLMVPLILWSDGWKSPGERRWFLIGWVTACAVVMGFYFHHLTNQAAPEFSYGQAQEETLTKHLSAFAAHPLVDLQFTLALAGGLWARGGFAGMENTAVGVGAILAAILLASILFWLCNFRDVALRSRLLPWLALGTYSIGTGVMVAMGRIWASRELVGALWNRYATHAVPLSVAAVVLVALLVEEMIRRRESRDGEWLRVASAVGAGAMLIILAGNWSYGIKEMATWHSARLRDATSQLFARVLADNELEPPVAGNLQYARRMDDLGLLKPPMLKNRRLDAFKLEKEPTPPDVARLSRVDSLGGGQYDIQGVAFLPGMKRVADGVLIAYQDYEKHWQVLAMCHVKQQPLFLKEVLDADLQFQQQSLNRFRISYGSFDMRLDARNLQPGMYELVAWVFDFEQQTARRIPGGFRLNTATGRADFAPMLGRR